MNSKILYVEDEPFIARVVSDGLISSGYIVKTVADGNLVMAAFKDFRPDICILDIMLPSKDGYELTKEIRAIDDRVPIIFVTAISLTEDVVKGFKTGGNDYLKKPFSMDELLVRVESLLTRFHMKAAAQSNESKIYDFGHSQLDALNQKLRTVNGEYSLSYKETELLELLIKHKNNMLERQKALISIWNEDSYYNTRSMDVFMAHLRKLLKDDPSVSIIGLRGVGYKLVC